MRFPFLQVVWCSSIYTSKCVTRSLSPFHDVAAPSKVAGLENELGTQEEVPVLIVGAGPVGLSLSILLSKFGICSRVVERRLRLGEHPQAHFLNNRTMEIFRKMEGLAEDIEALQPPLEHWRRFIYCTTLSGTVLGTVDHLQPQDVMKVNSPVSVAHFSQHRLVPLLLQKAEKLMVPLEGNRKLSNSYNQDSPLSSSQVLLGHNLVSLNVTSKDVVACLLPSVADSRKVHTIKCSYLVAADGAGSTVRTLMDVDMEGEENLESLISIHFYSKQLGHYLAKHQPGMLYFVFNTGVIGVIVAHDLQTGEFIAQIPFYPPQQHFTDFTIDVCGDIIRNLAGMHNLTMEVKAVKQWVMHAQVAKAYLCGHNQIILAGDAAHRFPPAGGFGMNTGIQDVHNLAWKLAAVLGGHAPPSFLSTYEAERRPIAQANSALSVANLKAALCVPSALGLNPSTARIIHKAVGFGGSFLPQKLQRVILDSVFAIGLAQLSPVVLNKYNPIGYARLATVQRILQEGHSLQLQFPAEDLGFRYTDGAVVLENIVKENVKQVVPSGRRREYEPSTSPGVRLPHVPIMKLAFGSEILSKACLSTLDLTSDNQLEFVLIVESSESGCLWAQAAMQAGTVARIPLKVVMLWPEIVAYGSVCGRNQGISAKCSDDSGQDYFSVYEWSQKNKDFVDNFVQKGKSLWNLGCMVASGAVLVRPDDHIAWRATKPSHPGAAQELLEVFLRILQRDLPQVV